MADGALGTDKSHFTYVKLENSERQTAANPGSAFRTTYLFGPLGFDPIHPESCATYFKIYSKCYSALVCCLRDTS